MGWVESSKVSKQRKIHGLPRVLIQSLLEVYEMTVKEGK